MDVIKRLKKREEKRLALYKELGVVPTNEMKWVPKLDNMPQLRDTEEREDYE